MGWDAMRVPWGKALSWFARRSVVDIALLALVVRLVFGFAYVASTGERNYAPLEGETFQEAGTDGYVQTGVNWLRGQGYSLHPEGAEIAFRGPVGCVLMGAAGIVSPRSWYYGWVALSCLWSAATLLVCGGILKELGVTAPAWRNVALLAVALHPYLVFSVKTLSPINVAIFFTTVSAWLLLRVLRGGCGWAAVLGGWLAGGALLHGSFQLLPLFAGAFLVLDGVMRRRLAWRAAQALVAVAVAIVCVSPWTLRNQRVHGMFIPIVSGAGLQYWIGDDMAKGTFRDIEDTFEKIQAFYERRTGEPLEIEHGGVVDPRKDAELAKWGREAMAAAPSQLIPRVAKGFVSYWAPTDRGLLKSVLVGAMNLPVLVLFAAGFVACARRDLLDMPLLGVIAVIGYFVCLFSVVQSISIYFVMVTPLLLTVVAALWARRIEGIRP